MLIMDGPAESSVVLHVVFNKESSNFVTGVKVIERCQTSKAREEHEQQEKTNTDSQAKLQIEFSTRHAYINKSIDHSL